jgi:hypothetical protein
LVDWLDLLNSPPKPENRFFFDDSLVPVVLVEALSSFLGFDLGSAKWLPLNKDFFLS